MAFDIRTTTEPTAIYHFLSDKMFEVLRADTAHPGNAVIADKLSEISNAVWGDGKEKQPLSAEERRKRIQDIYASLPNAEDKKALMEQFSRLGALNDMASQLARSRYMSIRYTENDKPIPEGLTDFATSKATVAEVINDFARVTYSPVFTAHPTNNSSIEFMAVMHELMASYDSAAHGLGDSAKSEAAIDAAIAKLTTTYATPTDENGKDKNLSAFEETKVMLNYLGNIMDTMPEMYDGVDRALAKKANVTNELYDPFELKLNVKPRSWGSSGDKDGNPKVNATTTLLAVMQHKEAGFKRHAEALAAMLQSEALTDTQRAMLRTHADAVQASYEAYQDLCETAYNTVHNPADNSIAILEDPAFSAFQKALVELKTREPKLDAIQADLKAIYTDTADTPLKNQLLASYRQMRDFGTVVAPIEMRETADELQRVTALFVKAYYESIGKQDGIEYDDMSEEMRQQVVTEILKSGKAPELYAQLSEDLKAAAQKEYVAATVPDNDTGRAPIAYQTLKRYELFRDIPEACEDQTLAEATGASDMLEVLLLSNAVKKDGKKPVFNIQPLFEQPENLIIEKYATKPLSAEEKEIKVDNVMRALLKNEVYREHLLEFAKVHPESCVDGMPMQLVQMAHSDNGRRGGMAAARSGIAAACMSMRDVEQEVRVANYPGFEKFSLVTYHGGSASDPYRGGIRAPAAKVRDYGLNRLFKETLQGGDLMNIFNFKDSLKRHLGGVLAYCAKITNKPLEGFNPLDELAVRAGVSTLDYYKNNHFTKHHIGAFLGAVIEDNLEIVAGARGSRQQRKPITMKVEDIEGIGPVKFLDPNGVRTITFSELFAENQIVPTWLGCKPLAEELFKAEKAEYNQKGEGFISSIADLTKKKETKINQVVPALAEFKYPSTPKGWKDELERKKQPNALDGMMPEELSHFFGGQGDSELSPVVLHAMYDHSKVFRDVIDRAAYGVAKSDLESVMHYTPVLRGNPGDPVASESLQQAKKYMDSLQEEYTHVGKLVVAAMTGKYPEFSKDVSGKTPLNTVRETVRAIPSLSYLNGHEAHTDSYLDTAQTLKHEVMKDFHGVEKSLKTVVKIGEVMNNNWLSNEDRQKSFDGRLARMLRKIGDAIPTFDQMLAGFGEMGPLRDRLAEPYDAFVKENNTLNAFKEKIGAFVSKEVSAAATQAQSGYETTHADLSHAAITLHQAMDWAIHKPVLEAQDRQYARALAADRQQNLSIA